MNTTFNRKTLIIAAIAGLLAIVSMFFLIQKTTAALTTDVPTVTVNTFRTYDFFASTSPATGLVSTTILATSTSATSTSIASFLDSTYGRYVDGSFTIAGAKKVNVFFTRGGAFAAANTGTTTFSVQMKDSPSGSWYNFNKLIQSTSTAQQATAVIGATAPGDAATSTLNYALDLTNENWYAMRCVTVTLVDGSASCEASASF